MAKGPLPSYWDRTARSTSTMAIGTEGIPIAIAWLAMSVPWLCGEQSAGKEAPWLWKTACLSSSARKEPPWLWRTAGLPRSASRTSSTGCAENWSRPRIAQETSSGPFVPTPKCRRKSMHGAADLTKVRSRLHTTCLQNFVHILYLKNPGGHGPKLSIT